MSSGSVMGLLLKLILALERCERCTLRVMKCRVRIQGGQGCEDTLFRVAEIRWMDTEDNERLI